MSRLPLERFPDPSAFPTASSVHRLPPAGVVPHPDALTLDAVLDFAVVADADDSDDADEEVFGVAGEKEADEASYVLEELLSITQVGGTGIGAYLVPCATAGEHLVLRYRATLRQSFAMRSLADADMGEALALRVLCAADVHADADHPLFGALARAIDALEDEACRVQRLRVMAASN